jgi:spore coat protein H
VRHLLLLLAACTPDGGLSSSSGEGTAADDPSLASQETATEVDPFDNLVVRRLDLRLTPADAAAQYDDMVALLGEPGAGGGPPSGGGMPDMAAPCEGLAAGDACVLSLGPVEIDGTCVTLAGDLMCAPDGMPGGDTGGPPGGGPGGAPAGGTDLIARDPMTVPVEVELEGRVWSHVAMRYKGNSSLLSQWSEGNRKLPFRLDFDELEDDHLEIEDQRFFGWDEVTFSSNWSDDSQIREWRLATLLGEVVHRDDLYLDALGVRFNGVDRGLDVHVSRIRRKLAGPLAPQLKAVRGMGYQLAPP